MNASMGKIEKIEEEQKLIWRVIIITLLFLIILLIFLISNVSAFPCPKNCEIEKYNETYKIENITWMLETSMKTLEKCAKENEFLINQFNKGIEEKNEQIREQNWWSPEKFMINIGITFIIVAILVFIFKKLKGGKK